MAESPFKQIYNKFVHLFGPELTFGVLRNYVHLLLAGFGGVLLVKRLPKVIAFRQRVGIGFNQLVPLLVIIASSLVFFFLVYYDCERSTRIGSFFEAIICFFFLVFRL